MEIYSSLETYSIKIEKDKVEYATYDENNILTEKDIESYLQTLLDYYKKTVSIEIRKEDSVLSQGLFYIEKQLEDFIIALVWVN